MPLEPSDAAESRVNFQGKETIQMNQDTNNGRNELVLVSSLASIGLAVYLYASGKKDAGIFVGLWAPTILGLGSFVSANMTERAVVPEVAAAK